jgi:hypothetical protein
LEEKPSIEKPSARLMSEQKYSSKKGGNKTVNDDDDQSMDVEGTILIFVR